MQVSSLYRSWLSLASTIAMPSEEVFQPVLLPVPLQIVQNTAAGLVFNEPKRCHIFVHGTPLATLSDSYQIKSSNWLTGLPSTLTLS